MWEHPDPAKRFCRAHDGMAGFWRECLICGRGSTDMGFNQDEFFGPGNTDPNFVPMICPIDLTVNKVRRRLSGIVECVGTVYDDYLCICHDECWPKYEEIIYSRSGGAKGFVLYRHYDEKWNLIYVGKTIDILSRTRNHRNSDWWNEVVHIELERGFNTHKELLEAEKEAIQSECPKYNVQYNGAKL
jgi:hypothetical protein